MVGGGCGSGGIAGAFPNDAPERCRRGVQDDYGARDGVCAPHPFDIDGGPPGPEHDPTVHPTEYVCRVRSFTIPAVAVVLYGDVGCHAGDCFPDKIKRVD